MKCRHCGTELKVNAKFCAACGTKVAQPAAPVFRHDISRVWPEWQAVSELGRGSYGTVYRAIRRDSNLESHAAIKVISIPATPSEIASLRSEGMDENSTRTYLYGIVTDFVEEIRLMEQFKGLPNIVSVEDYRVAEKTGQIGWDIYIRMELLTSFNDYICDKKLTEAEIIKLGCDICTALEICGQRSIIHRDIKPENIFINDFGYFKLGDFGIARRMENATSSLSQKGTFSYMAPEVANSGKYDARVDIYSLGIVLYRLLNKNRLPFQDTEKQLLNPNERKAALDRRIRGEQLPAPAEASPAMAHLILKACAFDPAHRFASATEMKKALQAVANGTYPTEKAPERTTPVRKAPIAEKTPVPAPAETAPVPETDKTTSVRKPEKAKKEHPAPKAEKPKKVRPSAPKRPHKVSKRKGWIIGGAVGLVAVVVTLLLIFGTGRDGLQTIFGKTYYYMDGSKYTGMLVVDDRQYCFGEDGAALTGWQEIDGVKHYFGEDGATLTGKQTVDGNTYNFDTAGRPQTGWFEIGQFTYYFGEDGIMVTGWQEIQGARYYFGEDGAALTGKQTIDRQTYLFGPTGVLLDIYR